MRAQIPPLGDLREGTQGRVAGWLGTVTRDFPNRVYGVGGDIPAGVRGEE